MATSMDVPLDRPLLAPAGDERFFLGAAFAMTLVIIAGFSTQLAMGRSTFYSPPLVHAHAIVFMGWVTIYLLQNVFVTTGRMTLHRRLGWVAAGWIVPMIVLGFAVTMAMVRRARSRFSSARCTSLFSIHYLYSPLPPSLERPFWCATKRSGIVGYIYEEWRC